MPANQYQEYSELLTQDLFGVLKENPDADLAEVKIIPDAEGENPVHATGGNEAEPDVEVEGGWNGEEDVNPEEAE